MWSQFHWVVVSVSCTESKNVTGIGPSLSISGLYNDLVFSWGCETVKYKVPSVSKSIPEFMAWTWIIDGRNDVCPFNWFFVVVKVWRTTSFGGRGILIGIISIIGRIHPIQNPVFFNRQKTVDRPCQVVLIFERTQSWRNDLCSMRPTRYFNRSSLCSQTVVRWARIVSKIRFTHMSQNENMPISIGFHMPIVVGIQQHRVFIPLHLKWQINPWCY